MFIVRRKARHGQRGAILVLALVFLMTFSALAVALATSSGSSTQVASNQHHVNVALQSAQSGLECARYLAQKATTMTGWPAPSGKNYVTDAEADAAWSVLCSLVQSTHLDGKTVPAASAFTDALGSGDQITTPSLDAAGQHLQFAVRFYRYTSGAQANRTRIKVQTTGTDGAIARTIAVDVALCKQDDVMSYALAGRGRMWLTGDTTIHGNVYSTWNVAHVSPFNMTSDSAVLGTVSTVRTLSQIDNDTYHLETLSSDDKPMFSFGTQAYDAGGNPVSATYGTADDEGLMLDLAGHPVYDADGNRIEMDFANRVYGTGDEIEGYHEGIKYGQPYGNMPGMSISDYNTDTYKTGLTSIGTSGVPKVTEYFPHASGNYSQPRDGGSTSFSRYKYENQTFSNAILPQGRHALFKNCTFENVFYIDASKTSTSKSYTNNVRFENCTFNGVIVTNTPQSFNWVNNCLYFTGEAAFNNQSAVQEATILAPHFNVNLGNTNPQQSDNNVLTGAIVGGIVDVRGNAQIYGTIISMCDTSQWTSGYVTNIGATLDDGGSETTELGDIGVISITPAADCMLPSGVTSPIVVEADNSTYSECI
jgi:Tfp pilus assembly protein PilX